MLTGCLYLPIKKSEVNETAFPEITVGTTTRQEVLEKLGEPNVLKTPRFYVYSGTDHSGLFMWGVCQIGGPACAGGMRPVNERDYLVLLEFNDQDLVARYQIESWKGWKFGPTNQERATPPPPMDSPTYLKSLTTVQERKYHGIGAFESVVWSPASDSIAAIAWAGPVISWTRSTSAELIFHREDVVGPLYEYIHAIMLAFSPDGQRLITGGTDGMAIVWERATGKELVRFQSNRAASGWFSNSPVPAVAFAPDGRSVASTGEDGSIRLWEATTGNELAKLTGHKYQVTSLAFSQDGKMLVSADTGHERHTVKLWDLNARTELASRTYGGEEGPAVTFSPDGVCLAISTQVHVELWRLVSKPVTGQQGAGSDPLVPWDDSTRLVAVQILYPEYGLEDRGTSMMGGRSRLQLKNSLAFSLDGQKLAAENGALILWDVASSKEIGRWVTTTEVPVHDFAFGPDGTTLVVAEANVEILEVPTLMEPARSPN